MSVITDQFEWLVPTNAAVRYNKPLTDENPVPVLQLPAPCPRIVGYESAGGIARSGRVIVENCVSTTDPVILEWVNAAMEGDQDAFAELVYTFQDAVYNLCYRLLYDRAEAEDAAQEAFLRAYLNLQRYDPSRSFKTWLLTIASNHCIDRLRRRRLKWLSIEDPLPNLSLSTDEPEPEDVTILNEQSKEVQTLLNALSPDYRAAVILRYWYDYSYSEIADILDTTESAIKSRLFRARQLLSDKLNPKAASGAMTPLLENA